jgi:hypothetical protein
MHNVFHLLTWFQYQSLGKRLVTMEELVADLTRIRKMSKDLKEFQESAAAAESVVKELDANIEVCCPVTISSHMYRSVDLI